MRHGGKIHKWDSLKHPLAPHRDVEVGNLKLFSSHLKHAINITNFEVLKPRCVTNPLKSHRNSKQM